jgi:ketosteroid isomerase-like protein
MNNTVKALLLLVGFFLLSSCSPASLPSNDEATVAALERKWAQAIVNRDIETLDDLIADDFIGTSWMGDTYSKTKAMTDIEFRVFVAESLDLEDVKVNVFGDTAVVTLIQVEKSKYDNFDCSGRYGYSNVWVKRDGVWKAVSSYGRIA